MTINKMTSSQKKLLNKWKGRLRLIKKELARDGLPGGLILFPPERENYQQAARTYTQVIEEYESVLNPKD